MISGIICRRNDGISTKYAIQYIRNIKIEHKKYIRVMLLRFIVTKKHIKIYIIDPIKSFQKYEKNSLFKLNALITKRQRIIDLMLYPSPKTKEPKALYNVIFVTISNANAITVYNNTSLLRNCALNILIKKYDNTSAHNPKLIPNSICPVKYAEVLSKAPLVYII